MNLTFLFFSSPNGAAGVPSAESCRALAMVPRVVGRPVGRGGSSGTEACTATSSSMSRPHATRHIQVPTFGPKRRCRLQNFQNIGFFFPEDASSIRVFEARRTGGRPSGVPCALPKDGFEYREGREKPLDPDLADVSSKKTTTRQREREGERESHREVSGSTPAGREKIDKASQRARPASVGYRQTNGASVRFPFIALQVLVNAILIFGVFGAPWLLDPDHLVVWAPLSLAAVALVPPVRGSAHQLVDIVRRRLQRAWGGRPNAAAGPGFDARQQQESAGSWGGRGASAGDRRGEGGSIGGSARGRAGERAVARAARPVRGAGVWGGPSGTGAGDGRRRQAPLALRVLFSVFPFLRYWGGFL